MVSDSGCDERCGAAADDGADKRPPEDVADGLSRQVRYVVSHCSPDTQSPETRP